MLNCTITFTVTFAAEYECECWPTLCTVESERLFWKAIFHFLTKRLNVQSACLFYAFIISPERQHHHSHSVFWTCSDMPEQRIKMEKMEVGKELNSYYVRQQKHTSWRIENYPQPLIRKMYHTRCCNESLGIIYVLVYCFLWFLIHTLDVLLCVHY